MKLDFSRSASRQAPSAVQVSAVDASPQAAAWARLNVERVSHSADIQVSVSCWHLQLVMHASGALPFAKAARCLQVLVGSWFEPLQHLRGQLAGIVSNPPYIPAGDLPTLQVLGARVQQTCIV